VKVGLVSALTVTERCFALSSAHHASCPGSLGGDTGARRACRFLATASDAAALSATISLAS